MEVVHNFQERSLIGGYGGYGQGGGLLGGYGGYGHGGGHLRNKFCYMKHGGGYYYRKLKVDESAIHFDENESDINSVHEVSS